MNDTFLCPGLVFRMPNGNLYRIVYVWSTVCDVVDIRKNNYSMVAIGTIRSLGTLVGTNYMVKTSE